MFKEVFLILSFKTDLLDATRGSSTTKARLLTTRHFARTSTNESTSKIDDKQLRVLPYTEKDFGWIDWISNKIYTQNSGRVSASICQNLVQVNKIPVNQNPNDCFKLDISRNPCSLIFYQIIWLIQLESFIPCTKSRNKQRKCRVSLHTERFSDHREEPWFFSRQAKGATRWSSRRLWESPRWFLVVFRSGALFLPSC